MRVHSDRREAPAPSAIRLWMRSLVHSSAARLVGQRAERRMFRTALAPPISVAAAGPSDLLSEAVLEVGWHVDAAQATAASLLQQLWEDCLERRDARRGEGSGGVYLHGPVGSGKTALMDMLFKAGTEAELSCRRMRARSHWPTRRSRPAPCARPGDSVMSSTRSRLLQTSTSS